MSVWTHLNSSLRIDSLRHLMPDAEQRLRKCIEENMIEGGLTYELWVNPQVNALAAFTLNIFGDLRDFDNDKAIEEFFQAIIDFTIKNSMCFRNSIIEIDVETHEHISFYTILDGYNLVKIRDLEV